MAPNCVSWGASLLPQPGVEGTCASRGKTPPTWVSGELHYLCSQGRGDWPLQSGDPLPPGCQRSLYITLAM